MRKFVNIRRGQTVPEMSRELLSLSTSAKSPRLAPKSILDVPCHFSQERVDILISGEDNWKLETVYQEKNQDPYQSVYPTTKPIWLIYVFRKIETKRLDPIELFVVEQGDEVMEFHHIPLVEGLVVGHPDFRGQWDLFLRVWREIGEQKREIGRLAGEVASQQASHQVLCTGMKDENQRLITENLDLTKKVAERDAENQRVNGESQTIKSENQRLISSNQKLRDQNEEIVPENQRLNQEVDKVIVNWSSEVLVDWDSWCC